MRVLCCVNENDFWLDVLKSIPGLDVVFLLAPPACVSPFEDSCRRAFPEAGFHDIYAAIRGEFDLPGLSEHALEFDQAARDVWDIDGHVIMELMSRQDLRDDFSFRDRRDTFYTHLKAADFLCRNLRLDGLITYCPAHDPFLFTLAALMRRRGLKTVTFVHANFDGRIYPETIERSAETTGLRGAYEAILAENRTKANLPEALLKDFQRVRGQDKNARAADTQFVETWSRWFAGKGPIYKFKYFLAILLQDLAEAIGLRERPQNPMPTRTEKEPGRKISQNFRGAFARVRHEYWYFKTLMRSSELRKKHDKYARPIPRDCENYVLVALHYQPEMSSMPLGRVFSYQALILETISASLPPGWKILVKEHPAQFNPWLGFPCQGRREEDYAIMSSVPNVILIPADSNQFELMEKARAVATMTGTVGWEALLRGLPVLAFGAAWYRECRGVWEITDVSSCRTALAEIANGAKHTPLEAEFFAEAVNTVGLPPYVGPGGDWKPWVIAGVSDPAERQTILDRHARALADMLGLNEVEKASV